jgi:hypothetical protein
MSEDERQQAAILVRQYHKITTDFQNEVLRCTRHRKEHGAFPADMKDTFDNIKRRMKAILGAMKILRERTHAQDPFEGMETLTHWPPIGHENEDENTSTETD